jgi:hypothetical protein
VHIGTQIRYTWNFFKRGAGKDKGNKLDILCDKRRSIWIKEKINILHAVTLTGLLTSCPETACKHFLLSYSFGVLTYLLTSWSRVLLEKLTVNFAASQEIARIYGTRKFLTVPTSARQLSLS